MRHDKAALLLRLALELQASRMGLTLDDMAARLGVGRRTAMRMRDAIGHLFPQLEEVPSDERTTRWRLPSGTLDRLAAVTAEDLALLDRIAAEKAREGLEEDAERLRTLLASIRAVMSPKDLRRIDVDLEVYSQSQANALRPGPRPLLNQEHYETLRYAITACTVLNMRYHSRSHNEVRDYTVHPYALLFGHRHYLVAFNPARGIFSNFSLSSIHGVVDTRQAFHRDPTFDVAAYAERSFGVYQEEPVRVIWRFSPRAAAFARDFIFHPRQTMTVQADRSLVVEFHAGGLQEMAWHLLSWGTDVEVLEPARLRDLVAGAQKTWEALP